MSLQKVAYYETEASKALTLAHSSHEKVTSLENQNAETIMEIDNLQKEFSMMKMEYSKLESKNKQLNEIITQKDLALKEVCSCMVIFNFSSNLFSSCFRKKKQ